MTDKKEPMRSCKLGDRRAPHGERTSLHGVEIVCEDGKWREAAREPKDANWKPARTQGRTCKTVDGPIDHGKTYCNKELGQVMICDDGEWVLTDEAC